MTSTHYVDHPTRGEAGFSTAAQDVLINQDLADAVPIASSPIPSSRETTMNAFQRQGGYRRNPNHSDNMSTFNLDSPGHRINPTRAGFNRETGHADTTAAFPRTATSGTGPARGPTGEAVGLENPVTHPAREMVLDGDVAQREVAKYVVAGDPVDKRATVGRAPGHAGGVIGGDVDRDAVRKNLRV